MSVCVGIKEHRGLSMSVLLLVGSLLLVAIPYLVHLAIQTTLDLTGNVRRCEERGLSLIHI